MPPAAVVNPAPPAQSRTTFQLVVGQAGPFVEASWTVPHDSPLVKSLPFIQWHLGPAPQRAAAPRSRVVGAILAITRHPTSVEEARLRTMPLLLHEMQVTAGSAFLHELDCVGAFSVVYETEDEWIEAGPKLWAKLSAPDNLRLSSGSFYATEDYALRNQVAPATMDYLLATSIGALAVADGADAQGDPATLALSRATILLGSKDTRAERADDASTLCIVTERARNVLLRMLHTTNATPAGLAAVFVTAMATVKLPTAFHSYSMEPMHAIVEFEAAYAREQGSAGEARAVEIVRIRRVGRVFSHLQPVLIRFNSDGEAWMEIERLSVSILPASHAAASTLVRLAALDGVCRTPAWSSFVSHAITANPLLSGSDLVSAMVTSHTDLAAASAGLASGSAALAVGVGAAGPPMGLGQAYGSVREASLADALQAQVARDALEAAAKQTGVERVETMMQSGSTVVMRATLLQEAWLQNKSTALSFASMDEPYIRPYFSATLCEDASSGTVPDRLSGFVLSPEVLAITRTPKWSGLPLLKIALEIEGLRHGCSFKPVSDFDTYTVTYCLNLIRDAGSRLFFALGLDLSPQNGNSFTDGVDLQIESCNFARTLPPRECTEWLKFSATEFKANFLDAGGEHYHAKLRSGRPDHPQAVISEFVPPENAFFVNVRARMRRAEPIAELRVALPTLLSAAPVVVPGTSGGGGSHEDGDVITRKSKGKNKGKNRDKPGESGPGSKSGMAYVISPAELFHSGVVFKSDEIRSKYNLDPTACLPVLLTKKTGDDALQLCPEHATHGDMTAKCHKRPKGFDLNHIYKNFTRKASSAELKVANWSPRKKSKA